MDGDRKGYKKSKIHYILVPTPYHECKLHVLQVCTNKKKFKVIGKIKQQSEHTAKETVNWTETQRKGMLRNPRQSLKMSGT